MDVRTYGFPAITAHSDIEPGDLVVCYSGRKPLLGLAVASRGEGIEGVRWFLHFNQAGRAYERLSLINWESMPDPTCTLTGMATLTPLENEQPEIRQELSDDLRNGDLVILPTGPAVFVQKGTSQDLVDLQTGRFVPDSNHRLVFDKWQLTIDWDARRRSTVFEHGLAEG